MTATKLSLSLCFVLVASCGRSQPTGLEANGQAASGLQPFVFFGNIAPLSREYELMSDGGELVLLSSERKKARLLPHGHFVWRLFPDHVAEDGMVVGQAEPAWVVVGTEQYVFFIDPREGIVSRLLRKLE